MLYYGQFVRLMVKNRKSILIKRKSDTQHILMHAGIEFVIDEHTQNAIVHLCVCYDCLL